MTQFAPDYGTDFACATDLDPMLRFVSGTTAMAQACIRRLMCRKGSLLSDPLYGLDVRDFLSTRLSAAVDTTRIAALIKSELLNEERIASIDVQAAYAERVLTVTIHGVGAPGPFALVLGVTSITVELLNPI